MTTKRKPCARQERWLVVGPGARADGPQDLLDTIASSSDSTVGQYVAAVSHDEQHASRQRWGYVERSIASLEVSVWLPCGVHVAVAVKVHDHDRDHVNADVNA